MEAVNPNSTCISSMLYSSPATIRKRLLHAFGLALLVALAWLAFEGLSQAKEPRYEGRTFSEWQEDLQDLSPKVRKNVVEVLGKFGQLAVPTLIEAMGDADRDVRGVANKALAEIGPPAIPALVKALNKEQ